MQTSTHFVGRHGSAMLPRQHLQRARQPVVLQPRCLQFAGSKNAASLNMHSPLPPSCSAIVQRTSCAAVSHSTERLSFKHQTHGWSSSLRHSHSSRGGTVAASDDDDSTALEVYSSSDVSGSDANSSDAEAATPPDADAEGSVATIQLDMPRRSMQVTFTCDKCGARTARMVNPLAWNKGLVLAQCSGCEVWHKLRDAGDLVQEIRYIDEQP